jgi:hypothetical protein
METLIRFLLKASLKERVVRIPFIDSQLGLKFWETYINPVDGISFKSIGKDHIVLI